MRPPRTTTSALPTSTLSRHPYQRAARASDRSPRVRRLHRRGDSLLHQLLFDEIGSLRHPMEEVRAFEDFTNAYRLECRALVATREFRKVAIREAG